MTYIEFFEKTAIENVCACLVKAPDRVILVGHDADRMKSEKIRYEKIAKARNRATEFVVYTVNRNNLTTIISRFEQLVEQYDDCVFDLTGGCDLYLVGIGIVFSRHPEKKISLVRFNLADNTVRDCDGDGITEFQFVPKISIEENIYLYGGRVAYEDDKKGGTYKWDLNKGFLEDLETMWDICKEDPKHWNGQISILGNLEKSPRTRKVPLETNATQSDLKNACLKAVNGESIDLDFLDKLYDKGLVESYFYDENVFKIRYKNQQVRKCLTKAGQVLEMKVYISARNSREEDNSATYNDVMNGVYIDWDGKITYNIDPSETENEIDVMMMHNLTPVFVSCKNGSVSADELYKLSTVAQRFGGKYAVMVLVAASLDSNTPEGRGVLNRADEMGIKVIDREVTRFSDEKFVRKMKEVWKNARPLSNRYDNHN